MNSKSFSQTTAYLVAVFVLGVTWTVALSPQVANAQEKPSAERPSPESSSTSSTTMTPVSPADEKLDKLKLVTGKTVSGKIIDCLGGEVTLNVTIVAGDQTSILERKYNYSDIDSIELAVPDITLAKKIVKEALIAGNGILAYSVACNLKDDPTMKLLSDNQDLAKAVKDLRAARLALARVSPVPKAGRLGPGPSGPSVPEAVTEIRPPNGAPRDTLVQAETTYKQAKAAIADVCRDIMGKTFPNAPLQSQGNNIGEGFSFRGIMFGTGVEDIPGLVKLGKQNPNSAPLVWYIRENEKPINDVQVAVSFGFYKGQLIKMLIISPSRSGGFMPAEAAAIDEALKKRYGNPQRAGDICKKDIAQLWASAGRKDEYIEVTTNKGNWMERFPSPIEPKFLGEVGTWAMGFAGNPWWLCNDRVLMAEDSSQGHLIAIEIKDVPLLVSAMNAEAQEYKDQKENAAEKSAKGDF
jgi:hypothetical protein